jgi:hypothetical protein
MGALVNRDQPVRLTLRCILAGRVPGGCEQLAQYISQTGVKDFAGNTHPTWAGATSSDFSLAPMVTSTTSSKTKDLICLTTKYRLKLKLRNVSSRLDWQPSPQYAAQCRDARQEWIKRVEAHEADHAVDAERIENEYNKITEVKTKKKCSVSHVEALRLVNAEIAEELNREKIDIEAKLNTVLQQYHQKNGVSIPNPTCCSVSKSYCPCKNKSYATETECAVKCPSGLGCFAMQCTVPPGQAQPPRGKSSSAGEPHT